MFTMVSSWHCFRGKEERFSCYSEPANHCSKDSDPGDHPVSLRTRQPRCSSSSPMDSRSLWWPGEWRSRQPGQSSSRLQQGTSLVPTSLSREDGNPKTNLERMRRRIEDIAQRSSSPENQQQTSNHPRPATIPTITSAPGPRFNSTTNRTLLTSNS